jgi:hypothetical protein
MNLFTPLIAAVDVAAIIKIAVLLLIFVAPAVARMLAKIRQVQPPPGGQPRPPRSTPADVADEIEKFLRRAGERRTVQTARPPRPPKPAPPASKPVRAEMVADKPKPVGGQVGEHVSKYLDADDFTRRSENLGKEVSDEVNKEIGHHLQQVFDHSVSKLEEVPGEAAVAPVAYVPPDLVGAAAEIPDTFATGVLNLLSDPDSLRQAIVLNEILCRPEHRWGS